MPLPPSALVALDAYVRSGAMTLRLPDVSGHTDNIAAVASFLRSTGDYELRYAPGSRPGGLLMGEVGRTADYKGVAVLRCAIKSCGANFTVHGHYEVEVNSEQRAHNHHAP